MDREYMQEVINGMRKIVKPYLAKQLKKINFEGCGNTDKAEFETDFEIVLTLAEQALAIPTAEPCEDAISRQAVLGIVDSYSESQSNVEDVTQDIISDIVALQPVNPQPKTGHWIEHPEIETSTPEYLMFYECSECGDKQCFCKSDIHKKHFCNNCGAKMVEPQESEEV